MPGTKEGARKAAETHLKRDPDFYRKIGAKGGRNGTTGGFAANPEIASSAGRKGGLATNKSRGVKKWNEKAKSKPVQTVATSTGASFKKT